MNQAVAAARVCKGVTFVGCVGDDEDGAKILAALVAEGIDMSSVSIAESEPTGSAYVMLVKGEHFIAVNPGANRLLTKRTISEALTRPDGPVTVLMQGELGAEIMTQIVVAAGGGRIIANLAPVVHLEPAVLSRFDPLIVNRAEASALTHTPVATVEEAVGAAETLASLSKSAVVTLGKEGAVWASSSHSAHVAPARQASVIDISGAGDGFSGAIAGAIAGGYAFPDAVELAVNAALLVVERAGVHTSFPSLWEVTHLK